MASRRATVSSLHRVVLLLSTLGRLWLSVICRDVDHPPSTTTSCQSRVACSRTGSTMTTPAGGGDGDSPATGMLSTRVAVEKVPLDDDVVHREGHLLECAHELGGGDYHRLLLAANNVSQVETGPAFADRRSDLERGRAPVVASGDEVLAEAPLLPFDVRRRRAVEHCRAVDDQEEGGTSAAEVAQMVVVIGCKWHLASGLEAANEVSGLRVQVATFMVSRSLTWRVGLVAGAERVYPKAAFISGGGPPRRPAAGGGEVRSLKTGGQRLQVVGHSSWLQLVEVLFAGVVVVHTYSVFTVALLHIMPPYRPQKVSPGGQQGELLSKGKRLYGGPSSSRIQRQLAAVDAYSRASSASASARDRRHSLQRLLLQHLPPEEPSNELHQLRLHPADPVVVFPLNVLFAGGGVIAQVAELFPGELEVLRTVRLDVPSVEGGRPEAHQQEELKVALQPVEVGSKRGEELVQLAVFRRSKQSLAIRFVDRHQAGEGVEGVVELLLEVSLKTVRQHAPVGEDGPLRRREAIGGRLEVVGVGARWAIGPEEGVHAADFDSSNSTAITTCGLLHPEEGTLKELQHIFEIVTHLLPGNFQCNLAQSMGGGEHSVQPPLQILLTQLGNFDSFRRRKKVTRMTRVIMIITTTTINTGGEHLWKVLKVGTGEVVFQTDQANGHRSRLTAQSVASNGGPGGGAHHRHRLLGRRQRRKNVVRVGALQKANDPSCFLCGGC
ncbi:hypothetical protein TYRP_016893 [Tyrophagus putrescentiae]|nr:hypothetical protein TYRP_016893 [Tyrophagus putrescentiae]